jgi:hypothetical protein
MAMAFHLSYFPCEVLRVLTPQLHCIDILNLWKSGNIRLRTLLGEQGGIQHLKLSTAARSKIRVPSLLYDLPLLEHLAIRLIGHEEIVIHGLDVRKLPPGLKSLDLAIWDLLGVFRNNNADSGSIRSIVQLETLFPRLERLSLIGNLVPFQKTPTELFLSTLSHLRLHSMIFRIEFSCLPSSLLDLRLENVHNRILSPQYLPPGLKRFYGSMEVREDSTSKLFFPESITDLDTMISGVQKLRPFPELPPTLKSLCLTLGPHMRFTANDAKRLPPNLLELNLNWLEDMSSEALRCLSHLPLTKLILPAGEQLSNEMIALLPRTLRHLDISYQSEISQHMVEYLPPQLETLFMGLVGLDTNEVIALLPRSLKRLTMSSFSQHQAKHLPPQLETLKVMKASLETKWNNSKFPETLKSFQSEVADAFEPICLPRGLLSLDISADLLDDESAIQFPTHLTSLNLRGSSKLSDQFFAFLPCHHLTSLGFHSVLDSQFTNLCISSLPPTLTSLSLTGKNITGSAAPLLPRKLKSLLLHQSQQWTDQDLAELPQSLRELSLPQCNSLSQDCLKYLPPQLLTLYIDLYPAFIQIHESLPTHDEIWK